MSQAFGIPAFPVDTHIHRLMYDGVFPMEKMLLKLNMMLKDYFPKNRWNDMHIKMIWYGREYSPARGWRLDKDLITTKIGRKKLLTNTKRKNKSILEKLSFLTCFDLLALKDFEKAKFF